MIVPGYGAARAAVVEVGGVGAVGVHAAHAVPEKRGLGGGLNGIGRYGVPVPSSGIARQTIAAVPGGVVMEVGGVEIGRAHV